jgi:hypothetical protein
MKSFTFDIIKREITQDSLYNIFQKSIVDQKVARIESVVQDGEECRLDLISKRIYGSSNYVEQLMIINNIINPFSLNVGDTIYYVDSSSLDFFKQIDKKTDVSERIANPKNKKGTRIDPTRQTGVPPTIRPVDFEQIIVDKKNNTIKLNTKLS